MQAEMKECRICSRKVDSSALENHEKLCREQKDFHRRQSLNLLFLKNKSFKRLSEREL
jgi:hypothetical protein